MARLRFARPQAKETAKELDREPTARRPPAPKRREPPRPRVVTMDTSTEELQRLLADNPRGLLHVRDELAGWLGGFDRYGGNGADRAFYLECWNGGAYVCDRVKFNGVPLRIEHASLAIIGGMVPDRLREALADADDGLPARFIFVWPEPVPIAPLCECGDADAAERRDHARKRARRLRALEMGADDHGQPAPRALRLDADAFACSTSSGRKRCGEHGPRPVWPPDGMEKTPAACCGSRWCFELLAWAARDDGTPEPASVSADAVVRAGGYIDYAAAMFERVIGGLAIGRARG